MFLAVKIITLKKNKMQTDSVPHSNEMSMSTDSVDSRAQIELSNKDTGSMYTMGANLGHIWKGGYFNNSFPPVYQYPFAELIPNSICYANFCSRMKTFDKWPKQMRPSAFDLVKSGFFYKGSGDYVECFFCGICLHDWETKDNALIEHNKWSPSCKFLSMIKHIG